MGRLILQVSWKGVHPFYAWAKSNLKLLEDPISQSWQLMFFSFSVSPFDTPHTQKEVGKRIQAQGSEKKTNKMSSQASRFPKRFTSKIFSQKTLLRTSEPHLAAALDRSKEGVVTFRILMLHFSLATQKVLKKPRPRR